MVAVARAVPGGILGAMEVLPPASHQVTPCHRHYATVRLSSFWCVRSHTTLPGRAEEARKGVVETVWPERGVSMWGRRGNPGAYALG